jgi:hypothetical protein
MRSVTTPGDSRRLGAWTLLLALVAVAALSYWGWSQGNERRAIARLPAEQRQGAYRAALQTLERLCPRPAAAGELRDACEKQATLLVSFPECDAHCHGLADPLLRPAATR